MSWAEAAAAVGSADGRRGFERLQSWSNWAQAGWNLTNVVSRNNGPQPQQGLSTQEQDDIDWEALLQRQNTANDEMCSENGRLRALIDKMRLEVQSLLTASTTATNSSAPTSAAATTADCLESSLDETEEELLRASLAAAQETLDAWLKVPRNDEGVPVNLGSFYHCGRVLLLAQDYQGGEIRCGSPGFQCESCARFQAALAVAPGGAGACHPCNVAPDTAPGDDMAAAAVDGLPGSAADLEAEDAAAAGTEEADAQATAEENAAGDADDFAGIPPARPSDDAAAAAAAAPAAAGEDVASSKGKEFAHSASQSPTSSVLAGWGSKVLALVEEALRRGVREDSLSPDEMFAEEEPEQDEMAMLVSEKIRLRELVEEQQERIEALESELQQVASDPSQQSLVGGAAAALEAAARNLGVAGLQDAPESALAHVGRGMLSSLWKQKADERSIEVGREYEVIGDKGAVVRNGESLRSDKIAELPQGSFVRVLAKSEKYPRRIEVVAVQTSRQAGNAAEGFNTADETWGGNTTATPASGSDIGLPDLDGPPQRAPPGGDDFWGQGSDGADDGYAADGDGEDDATPPPRAATNSNAHSKANPSSAKSEAAREAISELQTNEPEELAKAPQPAAAAARQVHKKPEPISVPAAPIYGWISTCLKDGKMLLGPSLRGGGPEECVATTSDEDVRDVALSSVEWEALRQEHEASLSDSEALSQRLTQATSQLRLAFEMRTVLHEIQLGVRRAFEREEQMLETCKMAREELLLRKHLGQQKKRPSPKSDLAAVGEVQNETFGGSSSSKAVPATNHAQGGEDAVAQAEDARTIPMTLEEGSSDTGREASRSPVKGGSDSQGNGKGDGNVGPAGRTPGPEGAAAANSVDWERLSRELETTKSAVLAGKSRLGTLQQEASQLDEDHNACLTTILQEISRLRTRLRRQMSKKSSSSSQAQRVPPGSSPTPSAGTEGSPSSTGDVSLWAKKLQELKAQSKALKSELGRATASEAALRQSVEARTLALRELLRREATSELVVPQCGPLRLPWDPQAERHALRIAVEEQLQANLRLRKQVRDMVSHGSLDPSDC